MGRNVPHKVEHDPVSKKVYCAVCGKEGKAGDSWTRKPCYQEMSEEEKYHRPRRRGLLKKLLGIW